MTGTPQYPPRDFAELEEETTLRVKDFDMSFALNDFQPVARAAYGLTFSAQRHVDSSSQKIGLGAF